jgi:plasmid stabilization system protein ParE
MAGVKWTPKARIALQEIAGYIARQSGHPGVADKFVDAIHKKSGSYGRQPMMGSIHEELPDVFRYFTHSRHVIIYEKRADGIVIHLVIDSAREWTRLFGLLAEEDN